MQGIFSWDKGVVGRLLIVLSIHLYLGLTDDLDGSVYGPAMAQGTNWSLGVEEKGRQFIYVDDPGSRTQLPSVY